MDLPKESLTPKNIFVPQAIVDEDIWANLYWPQMWMAKDACVGAKSFEFVVNKRLNWYEFLSSKLSPAQIEKNLRTVNRAHVGYEIHKLNKGSLQNLWGLEKLNINQIVEDLVDGLGGELKGKDSEDRRKTVGYFLSNSANDLNLKAFLDLWKSAANVFKGSTTLSLSTTYRESLRRYGQEMINQKGSEEAVKEYWTQLTNQLHSLVRSSVSQTKEQQQNRFNEKIYTTFTNSINSTIVLKLPSESNFE